MNTVKVMENLAMKQEDDKIFAVQLLENNLPFALDEGDTVIIRIADDAALRLTEVMEVVDAENGVVSFKIEKHIGTGFFDVEFVVRRGEDTHTFPTQGFETLRIHSDLLSRPYEDAIQPSQFEVLVDNMEGLQHTKADKEHAHGITDVEGLQDALDAKGNIEEVEGFLSETKAELTAQINANKEEQNSRIDLFEETISNRVDTFESTMEDRLDDVEDSLNSKIDTNRLDIESKLDADVDSLESKLNSKADKSEVAKKADTAHTHNISDVDNLQTTLDTKESKTNVASKIEAAEKRVDTKLANIMEPMTMEIENEGNHFSVGVDTTGTKYDIIESTGGTVELQGRTLVNLMKEGAYPKFSTDSTNNGKYTEVYNEDKSLLTITVNEDFTSWSLFNCGIVKHEMLKPATTYTLFIEASSNIPTFSVRDLAYTINFSGHPGNTGNVLTFKTPSALPTVTTDSILLCGNLPERLLAGQSFTISKAIILEGDYTNVPVEYFEGLKSAEPTTIKSYKEATEYEPYKENVVTLPSIEPLRSLPNGVCDEAYFHDDKLVITRRCQEIVINDTEPNEKYVAPLAEPTFEWYELPSPHLYEDGHVFIETGAIPLTSNAHEVDLTLRSAVDSHTETLRSHADLISQRVTKTEFNNLQIGGRNLWAWSDVIPGYILGNSTVGGAPHYSMQTAIKVSAGEQITYQRWNLNGYTNPYSTNRIAWFKSDGTFIRSDDIPPEINGEYYIRGTFTAPDNAGLARLGIVSPEENDSGYKVKFERGNKATDWTPAPEDAENRISELERKIDELLSRIATLEASQITEE